MVIDSDDIIIIYYPKILSYSPSVSSMTSTLNRVWITQVGYKIKIFFSDSIYHLWLEKDVRQGIIVIIHYDWGNITQWDIFHHYVALALDKGIK